MEKPTVSIITPAYNCVKTITETYESIKKQSFRSWEWIVVEDCSSDNSFQVINELAKQNPKVVVLRTEKNSGAAIARNLGIEKAKGKYIAFLDSDDLWKENKLEKQIEFMQRNNFAFTFTDYDLLFDDGRVKSHTTKKNTIDYQSITKQFGKLFKIKRQKAYPKTRFFPVFTCTITAFILSLHPLFQLNELITFNSTQHK